MAPPCIIFPELHVTAPFSFSLESKIMDEIVTMMLGELFLKKNMHIYRNLKRKVHIYMTGYVIIICMQVMVYHKLEHDNN